MIAAATARARDSFPESSTARRGRLSRRLAAVAGAAGAAAIGGSEAEAVVYTPTAGIAAAQGIPNFSFVSSTSVTLGSLRPPATPGTTGWDVDGGGIVDFLLSHTVGANSLQNGNFSGTNSGQVLVASNGSTTLFMRNIATGFAVNAAAATWSPYNVMMTFDGDNTNPFFTTGISGQFGFRFTEASDTFYGWGSLVIDELAKGQGYVITEAYYNTTPNAAISVGAVPQAVPEPASMALLGLGAAGVAAWRARKKVPATKSA